MIQRDILNELIHDKYGDKKVKGLEIGTLAGDTLTFILQWNQNLEMTTIDPNPTMPDFETNTKPVASRVTFYKMTSDDAIKKLKGKKFDFVWIDGDHEQQQVKQDIKNYLPLAIDFIGGHDYGSPTCPGVKKAVDKIFGDAVIEEDDFVWVVNINEIQKQNGKTKKQKRED